MTRVVLVPGAPGLLPRHASLSDPFAAVRAACERAVAWLGPDVVVLADTQGAEVAEHLLAVVPRQGGDEASYLVVGNGSARRTDRSPGPYDAGAPLFDEALGRALRAGDVSGMDLAPAEELWASVEGIRKLGDLLDGTAAVVDYDDDPFGVQYWVMRWRCGS